MKNLFDVLEHLVRHGRGYPTLADRDAHLHVIAEARKAEEPVVPERPEEEER